MSKSTDVWTVDLDTNKATHTSGLVVIFYREQGAWSGKLAAEYIIDRADPHPERTAARLMREAGDAFAAQLAAAKESAR